MAHDSQNPPPLTTREARGRVPGDSIQLAFGFWPGQGSPVVALHGLTASYLNFIGVAESLAGRLPLLSLDLRGRGDSDKPAGPYGFVQHAKDVAAAMRSFALGPSILVGHSMGAFIAAAVAHQFPELVSALLLVDGGYVPDRGSGVAPDVDVNAALLERVTQLRETYPSRQAYVALWRAKPHMSGMDWNPWMQAFFEYEVAGDGPVKPKAYEAGVVADLSEGMRPDEIIARLRSLRVPVILMRAGHGFLPGQPPLFPDERLAEIRALVPHIEDRRFPADTHYTIMLGPSGASAVATALLHLSARVSP